MSGGYILDKNLLEKRLEELAVTPYTGEICHGAMCYLPMCPEDGEYSCIICNKKTVHKQGQFILDDVILARNIIGDLKTNGYDVYLDEREFCQYCNVKEVIYEPKPYINIRFNKNDNYHIAKAGLYNLKILQTFLHGGDNILGEYENTVTLHENINIISNVTGLCIETAKKWIDKMRNSVDPKYDIVRWRLDLDDYEESNDEY
jgi:transposase